VKIVLVTIVIVVMLSVSSIVGIGIGSQSVNAFCLWNCDAQKVRNQVHYSLIVNDSNSLLEAQI
jgi:hypothetical protein